MRAVGYILVELYGFLVLLLVYLKMFIIILEFINRQHTYTIEQTNIPSHNRYYIGELFSFASINTLPFLIK